MPSGYLGVDIFFVISGFVITSSLSTQKYKTFTQFLIDFYARRVKRIIPALIVFLLVSSLLVCIFDPAPAFSLKTAITSAFGLSNVYLYRQSFDYFASASELNAFTNTWSLGVEEQFYILFPLIVWYSGFANGEKAGAKRLLISMIFLSLLSIVYFISNYFQDFSAAYYLMPSRFWEMSAGCIAFLVSKKYRNIDNIDKTISSPWIIGCICLLL